MCLSHAFSFIKHSIGFWCRTFNFWHVSNAIFDGFNLHSSWHSHFLLCYQFYFIFIVIISQWHICKLSCQFTSLGSCLTLQLLLIDLCSLRLSGWISLTSFPPCNNTVYLSSRAQIILQELVCVIGCTLRMSQDFTIWRNFSSIAIPKDMV